MTEDFADIERITRRVGRGAAAFGVASPVWLVLLLLLPEAGLGPMSSFVLATGATALLAWAGLRWFLPRRAATAAGAAGTASAGAAVADPAARRTRRLVLGAAGAIALAYLVFVLRAAG